MTKIERTPTIHQNEIIMNKKKLKEILDRKGLKYKDLWAIATERFGLDLTYKGFMSLLGNMATWKLIYVYAIEQVLHIHYMEVFEMVEIDVEKEKQEREKMKLRYPREKGKKTEAENG